MRPAFFKRLHIRLTALPFLLVVLILAVGGAAFYWLDYSQAFKDYYKLYLVNITSEKKLAVDSWFEFYKNDINGLSGTASVKEAGIIMNSSLDKLSALKRRKAEQERQNISAGLSALLADKTASGKYRMLAVISKDGRVFAGSKHEILGADWSDREFYKGSAKIKKSPAVFRITSEGGAGDSAEFVSVFYGDNNTVEGMIYAAVDSKELAALMKIEKGVYRTGKVELIDGEGNVVLSKDGVPSAKLRYNVPAGRNDESVRHKAGTFFYCANLEDAQFRLIGTVQESEAKAPMNFLFALYCACAFLVIIVLLVQASYIAPSVVSRPVAELTAYINAASAGSRELDLDLEYKGELAALKSAFEDAVGYFSERERLLREELDVPVREEEKPTVEPIPSSRISEECVSKQLREPIARIISDMEALMSEGPAVYAGLHDTVADANRLLVTADDLTALVRLENGRTGSLSSEFNPADGLKIIEEQAAGLIGQKEIGLVVDCDSSVPRVLLTDRDSVYYIMKALTFAAVLSTDVGTVTVTAGLAAENNAEYFRFAVSDTGRGFSKELLEQLDTSVYVPGCFTVFAVKNTLQALGGRLEAESIEGKGSVFTAFVPFGPAA
ncbi:MAG: HAMP domain-containing histidine kinase [Nitrospirae bacterium]|nr:MAG: HAMP domain-containing histidine kinase [Nitrospirota bacterium]